MPQTAPLQGSSLTVTNAQHDSGDEQLTPTIEDRVNALVSRAVTVVVVGIVESVARPKK